MDDPTGALGRAIESLREMPEVRPESTARLLIAVAAERQRQREVRPFMLSPRRRWLMTGAVAAATIAFVALTQLRGERAPVPSRPAATHKTIAAVPASNAADRIPVSRPVELVFSAPSARSVRVVGDFNGWDDRQSPMVRDEASGLWNVSLMLRPGRHVYAFVVNDTQWVRDPRAAAAPDADFGRPGSVLLVGRP